MGRSAFRGLVSSVLVILFPVASFAADSNPAMLYTNGAAWINGAHVPRPSLAIFSGDLLQTRTDSVAHINESGSSVTVLADSLVKFEGSSVRIDHGGVTVSTSKQMATTAGDVKVSPASDVWTEFNVTDFDGTVRIAARKGDLLVQIVVETPKHLNKRQEELLRELAELENKNVSPQRKSFLDKLKDFFAGTDEKSEDGAEPQK